MRRPGIVLLTSLLPGLLSSPAAADGAAAAIAVLPPALPWDGASRSLIAAAGDPWITPAEAAGLESTPSYDETVAWLRRLAGAAPEIALTPFGRSAEGRDLWLVIASADRAFTPAALRRTGKAVVLAQAGIHPGEIDGKDAGLMLLRDLTVGGSKRRLLERAAFLFVPIFNVDGHERSSPYGRINQRGPRHTGWRTDARNLNFNRDYTKADTAGVQAMLRLINAWQPDFYVDLHVTDGVDYQYDVTWGSSGPHAYSPAIAAWIRAVADPALARDLEAMGHVPGPLIFPLDPAFQRGLIEWTGGPRFSDGYGSARHLPTILVENHSLKPYPQRVLGTYVLLESLLATLGREVEGLRRAVAQDRERRPRTLPLTWKAAGDPATFALKAVEWRVEPSAVSGGEKVVWTGRPLTVEVPRIAMNVPEKTVERPRAYLVPPAWSEVIERLALHGVEMEVWSAPREVEVEMYRLEDPKFAAEPFEGRFPVTATPVVERRRETFPAGTVRVATAQPLGDLAVLLLEPESPDSFLQWGFFHEIFQRTEYVEGYVMEPMAERMLAEDPALREAFEQKLKDDEAFAGDPRERLQWFYRRTPYFDDRWGLYPVAREP
ncbi:MAG TPA: M14 family metallopeptidase [Thermoanaerobaculia bacterium]